MASYERIDYGSADGSQWGGSATDKLGMYGATPVAQRSDASQVAFTDNSTGTVSDTVAAGVGVHTISIPVNLATVADGDVLTTYTPGYKFKLLSVAFAVTNEVTTGAKATTLNLEIGTTNVSGGAVALTSANCAALGAVVAGSAITADNTGSASDTISIEASSTTAFAEGEGVVLIKVQNMDTADFVASVADKFNELRTALVNLGAIKGSA